MANYATLIATINNAIKTNGVGSITGQTLQTILDGMVASLGANYQFAGLAYPTTDPGTPDQNVFYIAVEPGTYTSFGGLAVLPGTIAVLRWNGSWTKQEIRPRRVNQASANNAIHELYISTDQTDFKLKLLSWNGSKLSFNIIQNGNVVAYASNKTLAPYEPFYFVSDANSPVKCWGIITMTETTASISSTTGYDLYSYTDIFEKPFATRKLFDVYQDFTLAKDAPIVVSRVNRGSLNPNGQYNMSYTSISRRFTPTHDALIIFGNKDAAAVTNKFFDFFGFYVHEVDTDSGLVYYPKNATEYGTSIVAGTTTDSICPIVVGAVNNPDGDNTSKWFTGQNHAYGNTATGPSRTMREVSYDVTVDNVAVAIGKLGVRGKKCVIEVVNRVQAYNTVKQDGTGREVIEQKITVEMDNARCVVRVEYLALEDVIFYNIPGAGQYGAPNTGRQFRFLGSTSKMGLYDFSATAVSPSANDRAINCIQLLRNGYALDLVVRNFGLGNLAYNTSQNNAYFTSAAKVYTRLTDDNAEIAVPQGGKIGFEFEYFTHQNVK